MPRAQVEPTRSFRKQMGPQCPCRGRSTRQHRTRPWPLPWPERGYLHATGKQMFQCKCVPEDGGGGAFVCSALGRLTFLSRWTSALDDHVSGQASSCMALFLGFPFTFNANWSAGKSPCFTMTESPGHPDVTRPGLQGAMAFCSLHPAGLVREGLTVPLAPPAAPSSPSAGAGGAGVRVSAGSTVGMDEATVWVSDKHRLAEGTVAHLAQLFV